MALRSNENDLLSICELISNKFKIKTRILRRGKSDGDGYYKGNQEKNFDERE